MTGLDALAIRLGANPDRVRLGVGADRGADRLLDHVGLGRDLASGRTTTATSMFMCRPSFEWMWISSDE